MVLEKQVIYTQTRNDHKSGHVHRREQETGRIWDTGWRYGVRVEGYSGQVCTCSWIKRGKRDHHQREQ